MVLPDEAAQEEVGDQVGVSCWHCWEEQGGGMESSQLPRCANSPHPCAVFIPPSSSPWHWGTSCQGELKLMEQILWEVFGISWIWGVDKPGATRVLLPPSKM